MTLTNPRDNAISRPLSCSRSRSRSRSPVRGRRSVRSRSSRSSSCVGPHSSSLVHSFDPTVNRMRRAHGVPTEPTPTTTSVVVRDGVRDGVRGGVSGVRGGVLGGVRGGLRGGVGSRDACVRGASVGAVGAVVSGAVVSGAVGAVVSGASAAPMCGRKGYITLCGSSASWREVSSLGSSIFGPGEEFN
ncbi:hypothetical protein BDF14DRAFT_1955268 [Spinellus fusiger]|nr:hypothetical protein BDF14DRAFT_1955268 [Spinellus fusiger]